jgi:hypothetical protein
MNNKAWKEETKFGLKSYISGRVKTITIKLETRRMSDIKV